MSLISCHVLILCFLILLTMHCSPGMVPTHLLISCYNPFTALLSCSNFIQVSRKVVSIEGSISSSGLSFLPEVEASAKLFLASMKVSRVRSKSNYSSFTEALRTQVLSSDFLPFSSPVAIPLQSTMFTFGSSSRGSDLIICRF